MNDESPSPESWLRHVAARLGPVHSARPMGAGVWRAVVDHRRLVVKTGAGVLDEAEGLRRLAVIADAPPVPEVVLSEPNLLVTAWVDQGPRADGHERALGRMLAHQHRAPWWQWGGGSSWIGECRVDPIPAPDGPAFYGARLLDLARRCRLEGPVAGLVGRLGELLPTEGPALVHGDLWWGNVLWGSDGRPWLIDPSVHGGHPEEDLAMLALFGPIPERTMQAYTEVRSLSPGWEERVELFQLYPLLVHTVLFGEAYRLRVQSILRRLA
jgi:fructosamine-3-kinase